MKVKIPEIFRPLKIFKKQQEAVGNKQHESVVCLFVLKEQKSVKTPDRIDLKEA